MKNNITMVRGDTFSFLATFHDLTLDLDEAAFTVRETPGAETALVEKTLEDGIEKIETGVYKVRMAPEDTADLDPGRYAYDFQVTIGEDIFTIMIGVLNVEMDVTRASE